MVRQELRKSREAGGFLKLYRRLRSRNACKTCAFGMGGQRGGGRSRASRGSDLRYNLKISLEEAHSGLSKQITVPTSVACGSCNGSGSEGGAEPTTCPTWM